MPARVFRVAPAASTPLQREAAREADAAAAARQARAEALRDRSFWRLAASFFVCGFHVSFLLAHMPGFIDTCGLLP